MKLESSILTRLSAILTSYFRGASRDARELLCETLGIEISAGIMFLEVRSESSGLHLEQRNSNSKTAEKCVLVRHSPATDTTLVL